MSVSYAALRARYEGDRQGEAEGRHDLVSSRLAGALDAIGWRSADGSSSEEVAGVAVHVVASCVTGHRDVSAAVRSLADLLYRSAATMDGGMAAPSEFVPAAEEVLRRYAGTAS